MSKYTKIIICLVFLTIMASCRDQKKNEENLRNVLLVNPLPKQSNSSVTYPAVIEEGANISVSFMADGKLSKVLVKEGDRVKKGQLIAYLDDSDYKIGVAQLEAQVAQMTKEKDRMDAMFERQNIAPNDYEKFITGYEQLLLQLEMAKRQLEYTKLFSPADGFISSKYLSEGEILGAGTPVFNLTDDSRLIAALDLPVKMYLDRLNIDQYRGKVAAIEELMPLEMISFTPDAENNMMYHLKLSLPKKYSPALTPGMNITVEIKMNNDSLNGFIIPSRAILDDNGRSYVWIYASEDSTIHKKEVIIEGAPDGKYSFVSGLKEDDKIVETGVKQLYEGEKVNTLNREQIGF